MFRRLPSRLPSPWSPRALPPCRHPLPSLASSFSTTVPTFKASKGKGKGKSAGGRDDLDASETVEAGLKTVVVNAKGKGKKGKKGGMVDVEDVEGESADYNYDPTLSSKGKKKSGMIDTSSIGIDILENSHFSLSKASASMSSAVERLKKAIVPLLNRVGRISPSILDEVRVDMPGGEGEEGKGEVVPLSAMASVTVLNADFLAVECYDPSYTRPVSTALYNSPHLNLTPQPHSATTLHLKIPPLTTSHRQQIHASTAPIIEAARVEIRAARQKGQKDSKKDVDAKLVSGEEGKRDGKLLDEETKKWIKEVEKIEASAKKVILDE